MNFAKIEKQRGEIDLKEWIEIISSHQCLEQAPDRNGINPFTNEEIVFPGEGIAYYSESGERVGNICLQEGVLLTTGVPISFCSEIAMLLNAVASEDDRS